MCFEPRRNVQVSMHGIARQAKGKSLETGKPKTVDFLNLELGTIVSAQSQCSALTEGIDDTSPRRL